MIGLFVKLALALEILLVCIEGVFMPSHAFLPLGGTHLAQLGLVLGLAVVIVEFRDCMKRNQPHFTPSPDGPA